MAKARRKARPAFLTPMAAQAVTKLPEGPEWLYELKLDGYRALLIKDGDRVELRSRNDKDLSHSYPRVLAAAERLSAGQAVIDGELVALGEDGRPSFQALQHRGTHPTHQTVFYAFDLLHLEGRDLTGEPLTRRREGLAEVITPDPVLRLSQELPGSAEEVVQAVRAAGLEGVIAKRRESVYTAGERSTDWVKLKLDRQQEFVVGGYRGEGSAGLDALLVGYYDAEGLKFAGKVRAGLVPHVRRELLAKLKTRHVRACPFVNLPDATTGRWGGGVTPDQMREMTWVRPELVVQVRFIEWTAESRLRHAAFLGMRPDKIPAEVRREP